jgi:hypothetical protein
MSVNMFNFENPPVGLRFKKIIFLKNKLYSYFLKFKDIINYYNKKENNKRIFLRF